MKHTLLIALATLAILCTPPLLTSCNAVEEDGSATFVIDTSKLASREIITSTSLAYSADIFYSYGTTTEKTTAPLYQTTTEDTEKQDYSSYNTTYSTLTVHNLPYGKEVTFEVELYYTHEEPYQYSSGEPAGRMLEYVTKTPVTATVTRDTPIAIALKYPTYLSLSMGGSLQLSSNIGATTGTLTLTLQDASGRTDTRQYTAYTNDTANTIGMTGSYCTKLDASAVTSITITYTTNGRTYRASVSKDGWTVQNGSIQLNDRIITLS